MTTFATLQRQGTRELRGLSLPVLVSYARMLSNLRVTLSLSPECDASAPSASRKAARQSAWASCTTNSFGSEVQLLTRSKDIPKTGFAAYNSFKARDTKRAWL